MTLLKAVLACCAATLTAVPVPAQNNLVLGRVVGQNTLILVSTAPNSVDARKIRNPQSVALDSTVSPPAIYVSDTGNNRVLGWKNSASFQNGAAADIVIGQPDFTSTLPNGPNASGSTLAKGLDSPTGLVVDPQGNLYVIDAGNNRVLRFPKPFNQTDTLKLPDTVIGQPDYTHGSANQGGLSASSLSLLYSGLALRTALLFDTQGNLWVTDAGNNRVLRFPANSASAGQVVATADVVVGQADFVHNSSTNAINKANQLNQPSGVAADSSGNLFVADALERVLVFRTPLTSGMSASSLIGGVLTAQGQVVSPPTNQSLNSPQGVSINPGTNEILVSDTNNNRVLKFPPLTGFPKTGPPAASFVYGQEGDPTKNKAGVGPDSLSSPVQVAATSTEVFIVDSANNRVVVFPQNTNTATRVLGQLFLDTNAANLIEGKELNLLANLTVGHQAIFISGSLVVDTTGAVPHLYIADTGNNRVLGYCDARKAKQGDVADLVIGQPDVYRSSANGNGGTTPNSQYLWWPTGVAVDSSGNLYVADTGNGRVVRFAAPCSQPAGQQTFPHANLVIGQEGFTSRDTTDVTDSILTAPLGVAFTSEGYLVVSDLIVNRVLRFEKPQGGDFTDGEQATAVFGQSDYSSTGTGNGLNQMNSPRYIAVDPSGALYVADIGNGRLLAFASAGTAETGASAQFAVTRSTDINHALNAPQGVAVNQTTGELWVTELNPYSSAGGTHYRVLKYPAYNNLALNPLSTMQFQVETPGAGAAVDANGDVLLAEVGNRVSEYFPEIDPVNGASFLAGAQLTPGMITSVWAKCRSTPPAHAPSIPLPTELAGLEVIVGGVAAPLFYAGDSAYAGYVQINFQLPSSAPTSGFADIQVVDSTTQQVFDAGFMPMNVAAPAFFKDNPANSQVLAENLDANGKLLQCNGGTAPCAPVNQGDYLTFYLTGGGPQSGWPADGQAASGPVPADPTGNLQFLLGTAFLPGSNITYSGAAPGQVGVWQINVQVPDNSTVAPDGKTPNPVAVIYRGVPSSVGGVPANSVLIQ